MEKDEKQAILKGFAASLERFYPELAGHFLCPTCLDPIPIDQPSRISEAHIIPRAAGGSLKTFLCTTKCNSSFGDKQDKWFGEYIRLLREVREKGRSVLDTEVRTNHFLVDGVRFGATYEVQAGGGLTFTIQADRTHPKSLALLESIQAKFHQLGRLDISVPIPLLQNEDFVDIGFLTAAYLLWCKVLGYSWILQAHLQPVREQIRHPRERILATPFVTTCNMPFDQPWIGVGYVRGELALLAGIANRIVFLPPADKRNFYAALGDAFKSDPNDLPLTDYRILSLCNASFHDVPAGVIFRDRAVVAPDPIVTGSIPGVFILFPPDGAAPQLLYHISEAEYKRREQMENAVTIRTNHDLVIPEDETGRPKTIPK